ncbi:DUF1800 domain-containing protein [Polaribacter aestuariivivens]|uniref:DUF1800 domain-containing protein n=1 Tax=Polaribacter aestuariivivens TaxID=2304626 RepID=A0A5S3N400_9FLAO|nr:DUF1800 family protein [Polaribacter aestuariivivens]TMM30078.1 DUF1800 domain-containing protein [Polaribacter aestuariivivens]
MAYLDAYSGAFSNKEAKHLLSRTSFGATNALVTNAVSLGLNATISKLFEEKPVTNFPLKYFLDGTGNNEIIDPDAKYGETWVIAPAYPQVDTSRERTRIYRARNNSSYAWSFLQMQNAEISIQEKLTLFWHNHFVCENTNPHREFFYMHLLRENALKNFKELVKKVTLDTNMLLYLSGNQNSNTAPNENYSRELLELFTIGKGDAVGNGDYTNYTEKDVVEIAKVLTGWRVRGLNNTDALVPYFTNNRHTKGDKFLSHRFNNAIISENGENEYKDVIDVIFQQEECSKFITRQLYKWFVNAEITLEIETHIILPLAKIIRENDYEIVPALKVLLSSDHFFESTFCMIKSPIDLIFSATKSLLLTAPKTSVKDEYEFAYVLYLMATDLEQSIYHHPDVAGWKAYYQEPLFYKTWVNSYLLPKRLAYCKTLVTGGQITIDEKKYTIPPLVPVLQLTAEITGAENPNTLITTLADQLFNYGISQEQLDALKDILIPGLPDFEWTVEYTDYLANPNDIALRISVDKKLRDLIGTMVQMSEFQIM